jgi:hypothetical protein
VSAACARSWVFLWGVSVPASGIRLRHQSDRRVGADVAFALVFLYGSECAGVRCQSLE